MRVQVTAKDLEEGLPTSGTDGPVNMAIKRQLGAEIVSIVNMRADAYLGGQWVRISIPGWVDDLIRRIASEMPVSPFAFEADVRPLEWTTVGGATHRGTVIDVDSNVLIVDCDDGVQRAVEDG